MGKKRKHKAGIDDGMHVCICCRKFTVTLKIRIGYICPECLNPDWLPQPIYRSCSALAYEV